MKTLLAACLFLFSLVRLQAGSLRFTETYSEHVAHDPDAGAFVASSVSSTVSVSLAPSNGDPEFQFDTFYPSFTVSVNGVSLVSHALGDLSNSHSAKHSIAFTDSNDDFTSKVTLSWSSNQLSFTATFDTDILGLGDIIACGDPPFEFPDVDVAFSFGGFSYNSGVMTNSTQFTRKTAANPDEPDAPFILNHVTLSAIGDVTPPALVITSPKQGAANPTGIFTVTGSVTDNRQLDHVAYFVWDGVMTGPLPFLEGVTGLTGKSTNFSFTVDLTSYGPGVHDIAFQAWDKNSNSSGLVVRGVNYIVPTNLTLMALPPGSGVLRGLRDGQHVNLGDHYHVQAVPAKGYVAAHWEDGSGNPVSVSDTGDIVIPPDGTLIAKFAPNPFPAFAGVYDGLIAVPSDNSGTSGLIFGSISVKVNANGSFSYKTIEPGLRGSGSGRFEVNDDGSIESTPGPIPGLYPRYLIRPEPPVTLTSLSSPGDLQNDVVVAHKIIPSNAPAGVYNFAIPQYACGSVAISSNASVTGWLRGAVSGIPRATFATALAPDGSFPLFAFFPNAGVVAAAFLTNDVDNHLDLEAVSVTFMPRADFGFTLEALPATDAGIAPFFGSRYAAPKPGTNLIGAFAATLTFSADGMDDIIATMFYDPDKNSFTSDGNDDAHVSLSLALKDGLFSGAFNPSGTRAPFTAVWLPRPAFGYGFFRYGNQVGTVTIRPSL